MLVLKGFSGSEGPLRREFGMEARFDFADRVVLVTGGTRGIGKGLCEAFLERGAYVFTCGRKQERIEKVKESFSRYGNRFEAFRCDITQVSDITDMVKAIEERAGRLDILVNNVGMNRLTPFTLNAEPELWDKIMEGNLRSAFLVTRSAFPLLQKAKRGRIINISSIAGKKASPGMGIYCVAKAGLDMFTKVLASELASYGINVNAVAPGMVKTDFSRPLWSDSEALKEIEGHIPMSRIAEVDEVVGPVLFLASDLANYITGEIVVVDGGAMVW